MKKRSILFCINYMHTGGVEKSLLALLRALPRDRFEPHIALMQHKGELLHEIPADVQVHILKDIERNKPRLGYPLRHATDIAGPIHYLTAKARGTLIHYYRHVLGDKPLIDRRFDIAVSYQGPSQLLDWYVATHILADVRVAWIHFDVAISFINPVTCRKMYPAYDRIFIVSESARDSFCRVLPEFADRTEVFHNLVDAANVRRMSQEFEVKRPEGCAMLCTVGRMTAQKGPDIAIKVADELKRRGFRFCWNWVGGDDWLDKCRKEAARLGLDDCLHFVGLKSNPYPYMAAADVYVQPSRWEGYCITLAEARAFGLPTVCTDFAGAEQTAGLPNAQIVKSPDISALADAIVRGATMARTARPDSVTPDDMQKLIEL